MWVIQFADGSFWGPDAYSVTNKRDAIQWDHDEVIWRLDRLNGASAVQV